MPESETDTGADDEARANKTFRSLLFVVLAACLCQLCIGYNQGVVATAILFMEEYDLENNPALEGLITSMALYGSLAGICFSLSFLGRKIPLIIATLLFTSAGALMYASPSSDVLLVGRFVVGLATGITTVNVPLFLSECAPPATRGYLVSLSYTFLVFGVLGNYIVNFFLVWQGVTDWRLMMGIVMAPAGLTFLLLLFLPESPRFLVRKLRFTAARRVLMRLRGATDEKEIDEEFIGIVRGVFPSAFRSSHVQSSDDMFIQDGQQPASKVADRDTTEDTPLLSSASISAGARSLSGESDVSDSDDDPSAQQLSWRNAIRILLSAGAARRALIICIFLEFFQQFSGITAVTTYTPTILRDSGIEDIFKGIGLDTNASSLLATIIIYVTQLLPMFVGSALVDRLGRRVILLITIPLMVVALTGLSCSYLLPAQTSAGAALALTSIILFKFGYSPGLGPIPPIVESEIFPTAVRAFGMTLVSIFGALFNIIILQFFPLLVNAIQETATLFIFAGLCIGAEIYVYFVIPETMRIKLESTHRILAGTSGTEPEHTPSH